MPSLGALTFVDSDLKKPTFMSRQNNLNTDLVSCEKGKHVISEKGYHSDSEDTWQQEAKKAEKQQVQADTKQARMWLRRD